MKRPWIVAITIGFAIWAKPAFAIFGFGDIVFDPSNYAEAIQQLLQMEQQYAQLEVSQDPAGQGLEAAAGTLVREGVENDCYPE